MLNFYNINDAENNSPVIVTGDSEEYKANPVVKFWENGKSPISELKKMPHVFSSFFYKPTQQEDNH